jgi:hypothetical protein
MKKSKFCYHADVEVANSPSSRICVEIFLRTREAKLKGINRVINKFSVIKMI